MNVVITKVSPDLWAWKVWRRGEGFRGVSTSQRGAWYSVLLKLEKWGYNILEDTAKDVGKGYEKLQR